jgi:hypothetical protein
MPRRQPVSVQRDHPGRAAPRESASATLDEALDRLASRVNHLGNLGGDPERFHAEKSDIAVALRRLARAQRGETRRGPSTVWRAGDDR